MKDIFVLCDSSESNNYRVNTALEYAKLFNANISGTHMIPYPIIPVYGGMYPDSFSYSAAFQMESANEHAEKLEKAFIESATKFDVPCEWTTIDGLNLDFIVENARYADLIVVPAEYSHFGSEPSHHLCAYLATNLGRPLLITPNLKKVFKPPKRVTIAWNESQEATRAVHDALPILAQSDFIQIVSVSTTDQDEKENMIRCEQLHRHLHHHGIETEVFAPKKSSKGTGHTIFESALEVDAELIVMGIYGHSRFREVMLGGTTKFLIDNSTIPLFASK